MIESKYRGKYQSLVIEPILKLLPLHRCNPRILTFLGLFFGLVIPIFLGMNSLFFSLLCLLLSGFFDTLDGSLARHINQVSDKGAVFDITFDRLVEFAIVLGLYIVAPLERGLFCLLMLGSILFCVTTFLVVGIFSKNDSQKSFYYSPGIIERAEAFIFFGAMMVFPSAFSLLSLTFSILVFFTGMIRIKQFIKNSHSDL